jgi:hypothetical protein
MAVDMLEDNDMSALAPSRLGNKNFINDTTKSGKKVYKTMTQAEEFSNLFGSANRKKLAAKVKGKWENLNTDCNNVDQNIALIEEDTAALIKRSATDKGYNLKSTKIVIQENQTALGELKKFKATQCSKLELETKAIEEKKFEEKLIALSDASVEKAKGEASSITDKLKSNKNILYIGGGVVVLGIIAYFIFRTK